MLDVNCKDCRYRYWLAKYGDHVWGEDCDKYGTDFCKKMNDPQFIEHMKERGANNGKPQNPRQEKAICAEQPCRPDKETI